VFGNKDEVLKVNVYLDGRGLTTTNLDLYIEFSIQGEEGDYIWLILFSDC